MSPEEWLEKGPKEPLIPPVIELRAEPAPGYAFTTKPLQPPVMRVDSEPAAGSTVTTAPLTPPVFSAEKPR